MSILGQVIYNIEISRYTLYTGEPIFTGKFRTLPGPHFWVVVYLLLDFGSVFPYLAANAATPLAAVILGRIPNPDHGQATLQLFGASMVFSHRQMIRFLSYVIFLAALVPLIFGGKIYNSLKGIMTFKIVTVMGFLARLGDLPIALADVGRNCQRVREVRERSDPLDRGPQPQRQARSR